MTTAMPSPFDAACWALHDGAAGNRRQALALAGALGIDCREWSLQAGGLAALLAPRRIPGDRNAFGATFADALAAHPPALAIGCGRLAALATRHCRAAGARAVQILDPRLPARHWDLVIVPTHDRPRGDQVITLLGSLNPVDDAWLRQARSDFPEIGALAGPRTALLLGGPTRATAFDGAALETLCRQLDACLQAQGGSLLVCASRRTPAAWSAHLRARYAGRGHRLWLGPADGDNPFPGVLAWADRIVVTPDSVNLVSEACATVAPVFVASPQAASGRVRSFLDELLGQGRIREMTDTPDAYPVTPLRETARVAAAVRARLSER